MARTGRPSSLTQEKIEALRPLLGVAPSDKMACKLAGIPHSTFRLWMAEARQGRGGLYADLLALSEKARVSAEIRAVAAVAKAAADDWRAACWWLTHHPNTRGHWSDAGALRQAKADAQAELMERVLMAIDVAVREPEQRSLLLESLRFHGCLKDIEDGKP